MTLMNPNNNPVTPEQSVAPGSVVSPSVQPPAPMEMTPSAPPMVINGQVTAPGSYSPSRRRAVALLLLIGLAALAMLLTWLLTKTTAGQLDLSSKTNKDVLLSSQTLNAGLGRQLNMADGFSFKVNKVQADFKPPHYSAPQKGKQFIAVTVVGGNRLKDSNLYYAPDVLFKLKDSGGKLVDTDYDAYKGVGGTINTDLKPGQEKEETIVFEVKPNESPLSLVYAATYGDPAAASLSGIVKLK